MYRIVKNIFDENIIDGLWDVDMHAIVPFCPDNTDYQQFLRDVEAGAELLDAEGNVMTQEQVSEFIETLL